MGLYELEVLRKLSARENFKGDFFESPYERCDEYNEYA
jgi:hypothetical protein